MGAADPASVAVARETAAEAAGGGAGAAGLVALLRALAALRAKETSAVALEARQLLIRMRQPSFAERRSLLEAQPV